MSYMSAFCEEEVDSVTNNFFAVAQKFSRPRLRASPAGSASLPPFSSTPTSVKI